MRQIKLTQGKVAIVDDLDFEWLSQWSWCAHKVTRGEWYASRGETRGGKSRHILMHREILGLKLGDPLTVDHRNRDTLDNRRSNLRKATHSENCANRRVRSDSKSGIKGVTWSKTFSKWSAQVFKDGKRYGAGLHDSKEQASSAYEAKALELFGEFSSPR